MKTHNNHHHHQYRAWRYSNGYYSYSSHEYCIYETMSLWFTIKKFSCGQFHHDHIKEDEIGDTRIRGCIQKLPDWVITN